MSNNYRKSLGLKKVTNCELKLQDRRSYFASSVFNFSTYLSVILSLGQKNSQEKNYSQTYGEVQKARERFPSTFVSGTLCLVP